LEVCDLLDIKEHTFYKYRREKPDFRTIKIGRKTYMRRETLDRFLEKEEERQAVA
jgi:hypothetical protein